LKQHYYQFSGRATKDFTRTANQTTLVVAKQTVPAARQCQQLIFVQDIAEFGAKDVVVQLAQRRSPLITHCELDVPEILRPLYLRAE
jgi:hypothetical protein